MPEYVPTGVLQSFEIHIRCLLRYLEMNDIFNCLVFFLRLAYRFLLFGSVTSMLIWFLLLICSLNCLKMLMQFPVIFHLNSSTSSIGASTTFAFGNILLSVLSSSSIVCTTFCLFSPFSSAKGGRSDLRQLFNPITTTNRPSNASMHSVLQCLQNLMTGNSSRAL